MSDPLTHAVELLRALGEKSGQIADALRREGITGTRGSACDCPLARYLNRELPGEAWHVADCSARCRSRGGVNLPCGHPGFIFRFDCHDYPDLIDHGPRGDCLTCTDCGSLMPAGSHYASLLTRGRLCPACGEVECRDELQGPLNALERCCQRLLPVMELMDSPPSRELKRIALE